MTRQTRLIIFFAVLLFGSFVIYAISPILTYILVALTGQGWLFSTLRWMLLAMFWALMFWKGWPKKEEG